MEMGKVHFIQLVRAPQEPQGWTGQFLETEAQRLAQSHMAKKSWGQDPDPGFQTPSRFLFSWYLMDSKAG